MPSTKPNSGSFWNAYLNYDSYQQPDVWKKIGGSIGKSYGPSNSNSCAARVSYGLNYANALIEVFNAASINLKDLDYLGKKGDGYRYIVSAMKLAEYLKLKWGNPDGQITTETELTTFEAGLDGKSAIFATPNPPGGHGHAGVLKNGYSDPYVKTELPVDVWILD